jgi:hypothetical protein
MLEEVKECLKITWNEENVALLGMIERGKNYLNELVGADLDYSVDGQPKTMLLNRCRYDYNNALEYFEENFQREILRLQLKTAVDLLPEDDEDEN